MGRWQGRTVLLWLAVAFMVIFWAAIGVKGFKHRAPGFSRDRIAQVDIVGIIISSDEIVQQIKEYRQDSGIKAILVRIESPGGSVAPSQEIYDELKRVRTESKKKVIASIGSVGASGGYYIASAADRIVADPGSLTGSIGVIMEFAVLDELFRKIGISGEVIKSGAMKDVGSPLRKLAPEERAYLQGVIDDVQRQFVDAVAAGRKMDRAKVVQLADGRVYTGSQAKELGLVDELGGREDAVKLAGKLAGIKGRPEVVKPAKKWKFKDFMESAIPSSLRAVTGGLPTGLMFLWAPGR